MFSSARTKNNRLKKGASTILYRTDAIGQWNL